MNETAQTQEIAYGIVPIERRGSVWHVLLVQLNSGEHWGFPKGHPIAGESRREVAERELFEETGLRVKRYISDTALTEHYTYQRDGKKMNKRVSYFIAEVEGDVIFQTEEVMAGRWIPLFEASLHLTYPESRAICDQVIAIFEKE